MGPVPFIFRAFQGQSNCFHLPKAPCPVHGTAGEPDGAPDRAAREILGTGSQTWERRLGEHRALSQTREGRLGKHRAAREPFSSISWSWKPTCRSCREFHGAQVLGLLRTKLFQILMGGSSRYHSHCQTTCCLFFFCYRDCKEKPSSLV